jgi:hypothetical protein
MTDCEKRLREMCDSIAEQIEEGKAFGPFGWDEEEGEQYLEAYSHRYIIDSEKNYQAVQVMVAGGGPNIWIDTQDQEVQGFWGSDVYKKPIYNFEHVDDYFEELWNC